MTGLSDISIFRALIGVEHDGPADGIGLSHVGEMDKADLGRTFDSRLPYLLKLVSRHIALIVNLFAMALMDLKDRYYCFRPIVCPKVVRCIAVFVGNHTTTRA